MVLISSSFACTTLLLDLMTIAGFYLYVGKEISPRTVNDVKLINAGKILENNRTIAESRTPVGEIPGGIITMHVVVQPPISDKNNGIPFYLWLRLSCYVDLFVNTSA